MSIGIYKEVRVDGNMYTKYGEKCTFDERPYVNFDGSSSNRDIFLSWMQEVTDDFKGKNKAALVGKDRWWATSYMREAWEGGDDYWV